MTSRRSFLRRLVGIAAAATMAPRVVEAVVDAIPVELRPNPNWVPAEPEMFKVYLSQDAYEALQVVNPPPHVTFASIKRISDRMRRDFGVERF